MRCRGRGLETRCVHGHGFYDASLGLFKPPIYVTAIFEQVVPETGEFRVSDRGLELKYSREENPTVRCLERCIASLEGAEDALAFNSGMSAISTLYFALLRAGSRVVVPAEAYGATVSLAYEFERKFGVRVVKAWPSTEALIESVDEGTTLVLVETITNPTLRVIDVEEVAKRCREVGAVLAVDNTLATPLLYNPLKHGANLVVHSATKYLSGHNDVVAGAVAGPSKAVRELWGYRKSLGGIIQPFEAFLVLRGISGFPARFAAQCRNAAAVAEYLSEHPRVEEVYYPGLKSNPYHGLASRMFGGRLYGAVVSFRIRGGKGEALRVLRKVRLIRNSPSFGGPESLISVPAISASRSLSPEDRVKLGITDNLIRLAVGLESLDDLLEDLDQALS